MPKTDLSYVSKISITNSPTSFAFVVIYVCICVCLCMLELSIFLPLHHYHIVVYRLYYRVLLCNHSGKTKILLLLSWEVHRHCVFMAVKRKKM